MATKNIQITEETMCSEYCDCSLYGEPCFEFKMQYGDCQYCCHMGECEYECNQITTVDYIRKQLDEITNEQMFGYISEYICDNDITTKKDDRDWLELHLVWLVAGSILDDISCGYAEYRVCES